MSSPDHSIDRPQDVIWDVLIVGTGMGGATLGHALAQAGHRVLFVEKGRASLPGDDDSIRGVLPEDRPGLRRLSLAERRALLERGGRSTDDIDDQTKPKAKRFTPFIGAGSGGSSALYGMALERLFAADFAPRQYHPQAADANLPERWPITYDELRPWYQRVEALYRVHGSLDPLRPGDDADSDLLPSPPFTPRNAELAEHFQSQGLHPYQLHLGCEHLPDCQNCQGFLCPRECKNDSGRICLTPALASGGAHLLDETTVLRLVADRTRVQQVICRQRGEELRLQARFVVLAAGGLVTPSLLLASHSAEWPRGLANESDQVGRNLMRHCIDLVMVKTKTDQPRDGQVKEIGLNDFYYANGEKGGTLQSFGRLPPISYFLYRPNIWTWLVGWCRPLLCRLGDEFCNRRLVLACIMEDLPYAENRVWPGEIAADGLQRLRMRYQLGADEQRRLARFRERIDGALRPYDIARLPGAELNTAIAHVCGTCRFGDDPAASVLDRDCRAHGLDNLYVADASCFASSGGINPSLTIAANALRVAAHLKQRL